MNSIDKPNTPHAAEILGDPRAFVAPVPSASNAVPEHVAATAVQAAIVAERSAL